MNISAYEDIDHCRFKFEKFFEKSKRGCWIWQGAKQKIGRHGVFGIGGRLKHRTVRAHRVSYVLYIGPLKNHQWVLHRCDVGDCVNPKHLYLGDHAQNTRDAIKRNRYPVGEAHHSCKFSSEFVISLRKEYDGKRGSIKFLADKHDIHPVTMRRILRRLRWKHI